MIARPQITPVLPRTYRLRWHLHFFDKTSRVGKWNNNGGREGELALISKANMSRFVVEAEHYETFEQTVLLDIPGSLYAHAQWGVHVRSPSLGAWDAMTIRPVANSLSVWTNDEKIAVYIDGTIARRPLTAEESRFDFREHRAGT